MGQHKFDRQFSDKLKDREISPKAAIWDKLDSRLAKEDHKSRSLYWISGIAASVAAAVLIFSVEFNEQPVTDAPVVVDTPAEEIQEVIPQKQLEFPQMASEGAGEAAKSVKEEVPEVIPQKNSGEKKPGTQIALADNNRDKHRNNEPATVKPEIVEEEIISPGLEEVIAEVSTRINEDGNIQESEIDALLYKAAAEISLERSLEQKSGRVDAGSLLRDVELELEQSFRDKVFDILKDGYLKARTAVANRNY